MTASTVSLQEGGVAEDMVGSIQALVGLVQFFNKKWNQMNHVLFIFKG
jgi:hypothetical protein